MTSDEVLAEYRHWLMEKAGFTWRDEEVYGECLSFAMDYPFRVILTMDGNRMVDGQNLRAEFSSKCDIPFVDSCTAFLGKPVSVFEVLLALVIRGDEQFMYDPVIGSRAPKWFRMTMQNIGLLDISAKDQWHHRVERFINRAYNPDGSGGGAFVVKSKTNDLRNEELWTQMNLFFDEEEGYHV